MNTNTGDIAGIDTLYAEEEQRQKSRRVVLPSSSSPRTVIRPIDPKNLSARNQQQLKETGRTWVSRNSLCPCGSRKRFKRCCMTAT